MAYSGLIADYLTHGLAAARPATPPVGPGVLALYYATDTLALTAWDGSAWRAVGGGTGTVTSVASGAGLSGGPITTTGTLVADWRAGLVTSLGGGLSLVGGALSSSTAPGGAAGGGLAGTYPNPTVAAVPATALPALTGDVTTTAGTTATTLATVNANVGSFGDATHVAAVTVNAKGLITAASSVAIAPTAASLTGTLSYAQLPTEVQQVPLGFVLPGKPATGQVYNLSLPFAVTIPASLAGSTVYDTTLATASAVFALNKITTGNTISALGTVTITTTNHFSCTLAGAGGSLAAGDVLQLVAPTQDASLSDIGISILAARV